jgi:hypothetical protein
MTRILNYSAVGADLAATPTAITGGVWTTLSSVTTTLTPSTAGSQIVVLIRGSASIVSSSANNYVGSRLVVDAGTFYPIAAGGATAASTFSQALGAAMFSIGPLSVAAHSLTVQLSSFQTGTYICRSNSFSAYEFLFVEVWEFIA